MRRLSRLLLSLLALFAMGCAPVLQRAEDARQVTPYFRPPTSPALTTPTLPGAAQPTEPSAAEAAAAQLANCENNLRFVADLTIPDGTEVTPLAVMDKRWEVENNGTCSWNSAYRIRLIAGEDMGTQKEMALYPARSGTRATVRIQFQAPAEAGPHKSAWQAFGPNGEPFGDPFFIDIVVAPGS